LIATGPQANATMRITETGFLRARRSTQPTGRGERLFVKNGDRWEGYTVRDIEYDLQCWDRTRGKRYGFLSVLCPNLRSERAMRDPSPRAVVWVT
jgi:hypothetical protein